MAAAQGGAFATLSGTVHDASGGVIPSATVVLTSAGTAAELRTITDANGRFAFPRVSPDDYGLHVEKTGFRRATVTGVSLAVNDALSRDVVLDTGDVSETVTVSGAASVQTRGSGVSLAVDTRNLETLPLNGRDWTKLTMLVPGAGQTATAPVSGVRSSYNTTTIDGVGSNNERSAEPLAGASAYSGPGLISTESVQEFRVITANADATFGRSSGEQVNVITKSGTKALRGSGLIDAPSVVRGPGAPRRQRAYYALVRLVGGYTGACAEAVLALQPRHSDKPSLVAVSDRRTLRGLTQFLTQFGFSGSATSP